METPLDLLSRAAVLVRDREVTTREKENSDTASDLSVHSEESPLASKSRKRRHGGDEFETLSDTTDVQSPKQSGNYSVRKRRTPLFSHRRQERNGRLRSASPAASATLSPSLYSYCGAAVPCSHPVRPVPSQSGSACQSCFQVQGSSVTRHPSQPFPLQIPQHIQCSVPLRPSGMSAFSRPATKWSQTCGNILPPEYHGHSAFDVTENRPAPSSISLTNLTRPLPVLPYYIHPMSRLHLPLDVSDRSARKIEQNQRKGNLNECQSGENNSGSPLSPTETVIDEHFRRSLAGRRLRQFYPFPTSDGDSVDDHFKRALGDNWDRKAEGQLT